MIPGRTGIVIGGWKPMLRRQAIIRGADLKPREQRQPPQHGRIAVRAARDIAPTVEKHT